MTADSEQKGTGFGHGRTLDNLSLCNIFSYSASIQVADIRQDASQEPPIDIRPAGIGEASKEYFNA